MTEIVSHGWLQKNIRPLMSLICLVAFAMNVTGVTTMMRGEPLNELELQIIWGILGANVLSRGGEKVMAIHKAGGT